MPVIALEQDFVVMVLTVDLPGNFSEEADIFVRYFA